MMIRGRPLLLGVVIALAAFNLRPAVASVGPVLPELRDGLHLSGTATAVLTMLPVLCFGGLAPAAPRLARRFGIEPVVLAALLAIAAGLAGRALGGPPLLFALTVLVGGGIAVANVLLPPLIKRDFPERTGAMMGLYTMAVSGSAAVAAGVTIPIAQALGAGWRGALGEWAAPAVLAALAWAPLLRGRGRWWSADRHSEYSNAEAPRVGGTLLRSPLAWQVTAFFGLQSTVFYAVLAWLPSIYRDHGYGPAAAGFVLSVSGLVQIPVTLVLPGFAARAKSQVWYLAAATGVLGAGLVGVLVAPTAAPYAWSVLVGVGSGGSFALALALFVLRARRVDDTARLSAMAQSIGYLMSSFGPLLFGLLHEASGSWNPPLSVLIALLVPQLGCAMLAGRPRTVSV
jgi:CP family cyanate transporter-like MFS transporter